MPTMLIGIKKVNNAFRNPLIVLNGRKYAYYIHIRYKYIVSSLQYSVLNINMHIPSNYITPSPPIQSASSVRHRGLLVGDSGNAPKHKARKGNCVCQPQIDQQRFAGGPNDENDGGCKW